MTQTEALPFEHEYHEEMEHWLRRRFRYLCGGLAAVTVGGFLTALIGLWPGASDSPVIPGISATFMAAVIFYFYRHKKLDTADRDQILMMATTMIMMVGGIDLVGQFTEYFVARAQQTASTNDRPHFLVLIAFWHILACLFLPWRPAESLRPFVLLVVIHVIMLLFIDVTGGIGAKLLSLVFIPVAFLPGLAMCSWRLARHSREFSHRMLGRQFLSARRELSDARKIHESMFPDPYDDGFVRFQYAFKPMHDLGGDFIHFHISPEGVLSLALLDVTGHGLAAALTVNRLYGELERIHAETELAAPGEVLRLLNKYIGLTLSRHNIYVTGICLTLDPYRHEITWASGGHPPAIIRRQDGNVDQLAATAVVLGALEDAEFDHNQQTIDIMHGDTIVLYTDGAFEARNKKGEQYGLPAFLSLFRLQPPPRNWPDYLRSVVEKFVAGRTEDDILIAALTFLSSRTDSSQAEPLMDSETESESTTATSSNEQ